MVMNCEKDDMYDLQCCKPHAAGVSWSHELVQESVPRTWSQIIFSFAREPNIRHRSVLELAAFEDHYDDYVTALASVRTKVTCSIGDCYLPFQSVVAHFGTSNYASKRETLCTSTALWIWVYIIQAWESSPAATFSCALLAALAIGHQ